MFPQKTQETDNERETDSLFSLTAGQKTGHGVTQLSAKHRERLESAPVRHGGDGRL